jgi:hypothetical protein
MSNIAETVAQAKAAQQNLPQTAPAPTSTAVALPAKRQTAADFLNSARVNVDHFLKVSADGDMRFGSNAALIPEFEAVLDCSKLTYLDMVVYGANPVVYARTYDGGASVQGSPVPWQTHLERAQFLKPGKQGEPFKTADVVLRLETDVAGFEKGKPVAGVGKAGQAVGYTPPYSGTSPFMELLKAIQLAGGDVERSKVKVKVTSKSTTNKGGTKYGLVEYEFLGLIEG